MPLPPGTLLEPDAIGATAQRFVSFPWGDDVYRVATQEWGDPANPRIVLCVHGLTRRATDFEVLAQHLARHARVVAVDLPGRGRSDWLAGPQDYEFAPYLRSLTAVMDRLQASQVDWVGTSLGGLLGMAMAGIAPERIRRLVMNDVGPFLPKESLERIASYADGTIRYHDPADAEARIRRVMASYGLTSDEAWRRLTATSLRRFPDGSLGPQFDPAVASRFTSQRFEHVDLWEAWAKVTCPVLVIRGTESDLLDEATLARMIERGGVAVHRVPGAGHAPMLQDEASIEAIERFLDAA